MPYIPPEVVAKAREMDLLTYLRNYEPQELVHFDAGLSNQGQRCTVHGGGGADYGTGGGAAACFRIQAEAGKAKDAAAPKGQQVRHPDLHNAEFGEGNAKIGSRQTDVKRKEARACPVN